MARKKKNRCAACGKIKRTRRKYCSACKCKRRIKQVQKRCNVKCKPKKRRMRSNPQLQIFENPGCGVMCDCCGVGMKKNPGDACCMGCALNPMVCNPYGIPPKPPRRRRRRKNP